MDLSKAKYLVPNALTLGSIYCGISSIHLSTTAQGPKDMMMAAWLIVIAMVCDGMDGRVARMTKSESEFGVQLDSLADLVSFGVAPGFLLYNWGMQPLGRWGLFFAFVFAACTALRLARFNVMAAQHAGVMKYFLGLPSPLAAGAVVSVVLAHVSMTKEMTTLASGSVAALGTLLGVLMVSNVRYRTFKDVNFRGRAGVLAIGLIFASAAVGMAFKPGVAFVILMMLYIAIGIIGGVVSWSRAILGEEAEDFDEFAENEEI
jgi:CDP-diacylglycerol--serine O-phosphatidyltransferase